MDRSTSPAVIGVDYGLSRPLDCEVFFVCFRAKESKCLFQRFFSHPPGTTVLVLVNSLDVPVVRSLLNGMGK